MKVLTSVARIAATAALLTTGFVAVTASPAMAAGCTAGYISGNGYRAGACTGYGTGFKVRAQAKCFGTTRYGSWVPNPGYSYVYCDANQVMSGGTYQVSP